MTEETQVRIGAALIAVWTSLPDWTRRALWTLVQTFVALEVAAGANYLDAASLKLAALGGLAAGLSVAKSGFVAWWKIRRQSSRPERP